MAVGFALGATLVRLREADTLVERRVAAVVVVVVLVEPVGLALKIPPIGVRLATFNTDRHSFSTSVADLLPGLAHRVNRVMIR